MIMQPALRKAALTVHIACSVGFLGSVGSFLALALAGLLTHDAPMARAAYMALEMMTWFAIIPFAVAALLTGLIQSLCTPWGLFRYYWVLVKLLLTVFAIIVLLMQTGLIGSIANRAAEMAFMSSDLDEAKLSLILHAFGGILVLLTATTLSVYKPPGLICYGASSRGRPPHR